MRIVWRGLRDRTQRERWHERVGWYRGPLPADAIWVHAVSVGESMAAVPLVRALRQAWPEQPVVVTTTTATGAATVTRMLGDSVTHCFFPYDLPWILQRFLRRVRPRGLLLLETELWPNTLRSCRRAGVPVLLVNARLSPRSLRGYRLLSPLSRAVVRDIDCIAAQGQRDADRFFELGAAPGQVCVTGSLKFDLIPPPSLREQAEVLRRELGINRPIVMLGSTRDGEEALLLDAIERLREEFAQLLVVVAPRHPDRFDEVAGLLEGAGHRLARFSRGRGCAPEHSAYLLDAMGELLRFYAAADIAYVGGSLLPYGGHNVLEPASVGIPILCGPYTHNFAEICQMLIGAGALEVVHDADDFVAAAQRWLRDSNERDRVGLRGQALVHEHRGATRRTMDLIEAHLGAPDAVAGR
ncbi:MAG: lipid IV(A) 3-deoxy-D-manno-octulosonic acid transferase [Gammaproteobacteria bacterium]|nr:lipid IV(A) 3-deoxy-D-manno-octulosonic acid transferase [Gammaproteobacteria bacterium]MCP5202041.1 lipid IV(A) 3-deoxy-D-manno-octulosonic acid transferase [Gammaproteobacteria bacterium]